MFRFPGFQQVILPSFSRSGLYSVAFKTRITNAPNILHISPRRNFTLVAADSSGRRERPGWQRRFRSVLYMIIFGTKGYNGSAYVVDRLIGPLPTPGTAEDEEALKEVRTKFEKLEVVKRLRMDPDFVEGEAYSSSSPVERAQR